MNKLYSIFSTYFHTWNYLLSIIYSRLVYEISHVQAHTIHSHTGFSQKNGISYDKILFYTFFVLLHNSAYVRSCITFEHTPLARNWTVIHINTRTYIWKRGRAIGWGKGNGSTIFCQTIRRNCQFFRLAWTVQIHVMLVTIAKNYRLRGIKTRNRHGSRKIPQILQIL